MIEYDFWLSLVPPTITHQTKRVNWAARTFYDSPEAKEARAIFAQHLLPHVPPEPIKEPVRLYVAWCYPLRGQHRDGDPKTSRPDLDNAQKLLQDEMTKAGFWRDDALITALVLSKRWAANPGIYIRIEEDIS